jgi:hypothetical protein
VTLLKFLPAVAVVVLVIGVAITFFMFRAHAMRAFAATLGFEYKGPAAPKWGFPSFPKIKPNLPFHMTGYPLDQIRQVWNLMEGQQSGVRILIFDSVIGRGKGQYATFIAWQGQQNPFGRSTFTNYVLHQEGWTALYRIPALKAPWLWTMSIKRLNHNLNKLQVGSAGEFH